MFSDLASIRTALRDRLGPALPEEWRIVDHIATPAETIVPILHFEFTGIDSTANGQPLGRDTVACSFDLVIETPRSDDAGAEDDVDDHVLTLARVLQKSSDIYWDTARKQRLADGGHMTWRVSLTLLTNTAPSEGD